MIQDIINSENSMKILLFFPQSIVTENAITTLYNVCSVHRGDIMSTSGGYHEYIGGMS